MLEQYHIDGLREKHHKGLRWLPSFARLSWVLDFAIDSREQLIQNFIIMLYLPAT